MNSHKQRRKKIDPAAGASNGGFAEKAFFGYIRRLFA